MRARVNVPPCMSELILMKSRFNAPVDEHFPVDADTKAAQETRRGNTGTVLALEMPLNRSGGQAQLSAPLSAEQLAADPSATRSSSPGLAAPNSHFWAAISPNIQQAAYPLCSLSFAQYGIFDPFQSLQLEVLPAHPGNTTQGSVTNGNPLSHYASRLPSLQAEDQPPPNSLGPRQRPKQLMLPLSRNVYDKISSMIDGQKDTLPPKFHLPSRNAFSRYLEGFFNGFYDNLPFLHLPTFSPVKSPLMLVLAIVAMGAQFRFEREDAITLWKGAKALVDDKFRYQGKGVNMAFHTPMESALSPAWPCHASYTDTPGTEEDIPNLTVSPHLAWYSMQTIRISKTFWFEA
ncbi:hypothetical protein CNMCM5623_009029 [Aspergillus felis]|uniref:Xylanolytic transcriptional activator regulatory domain-containing protein n=1 Tax=Aspergillus felis TaxID=1287682 RepID=A0A8H6URV2_9EURO|nr:hypothetical protein CNMCM5623_009029 [Aspergillus felis]